MTINLEPETSPQDGRVMKAVVRPSETTAGVQATLVQGGTIRVGDRIPLEQIDSNRRIDH